MKTIPFWAAGRVSWFMGFTHTIQSTASMRDRSLVGRPMASRMMAMVMMPPAGMPAAPTLEAVAVTLQMLRDHHNTMSRKNLLWGWMNYVC